MRSPIIFIEINIMISGEKIFMAEVVEKWYRDYKKIWYPEEDEEENTE